MIESLVKNWEENKDTVVDELIVKNKTDSLDYADLVKAVVSHCGELDVKDSWDSMDPNRITEINHGSYSGTLVYIISGETSHPDSYWYCKISYGSCSACDTLQSVLRDSPELWDDDEDALTKAESFRKQLTSLCLHIVQAIKSLDGGAV